MLAWNLRNYFSFLQILPYLACRRVTEGPSQKQLVHHFAVHVSQSKIATLKAIGEFFVIKAEEVKNRCVKIVNVDGIFFDAPADFVRLPDGLAAFYAASGHPHAERIRVMIATGNGLESGTVFS